MNSSNSICITQCDYGVPQGSILGPLLFLVYINDLPLQTSAKSILFADDTTVYVSGKNVDDLFNSMNSALSSLADWFCSNSLSLNINKSNYMFFTRVKGNVLIKKKLYIGNDPLSRVFSVKFLGVHLDDKLEWSKHLSFVKTKLASGLYVLNRLKNTLPLCIKQTLYFTLFQPYLTYGNVLWGSALSKYTKSLFSMQKKAIRSIYSANYNVPTSPLFKKCNVLKLHDLHNYQICQFMYLIQQEVLAFDIKKHFERFDSSGICRNTRQSKLFRIPLVKLDKARRSIIFEGPKLWSHASNYLKDSSTIRIFCKRVKEFYLSNY